MSQSQMDSSKENGGYWLTQRSEECIKTTHLLNLCLKGKVAANTNVWKIDNPELIVGFEKRARSLLTLTTFVDSASLDARNSLFEVCRRGFLFPTNGNGMVFTHGNVEGAVPDNGTVKTYILCKVAVGKSYILDDPKGPRNIPPGYDSLYLSSVVDSDGDGQVTAAEYEAAATHDGRPPSEYQHRYIVLDPTLVLPVHVVRCTPKDAQEVANEVDEAETDPAKVHDRFDFFDPVLYQPVSLRDKMTGSHSSGEASTHKLRPIQEAYEAALEQSRKKDPKLKNQRSTILQLLTQLDDKLREVNLNFANVEEKIYQVLKEALMQLQTETKKKVSGLLSLELELRRKLEQIDWSENHLNNVRESSKPVDFLTVWRSHTQMREEICSQRMLEGSVLAGIKADLELKGSISVLSQSEQQQQMLRGQVSGSALSDMMRELSATNAANAAAGAGVPPTPSGMSAQQTSSMLSQTLAELHGNAAMPAMPATAAVGDLAGLGPAPALAGMAPGVGGVGAIAGTQYSPRDITMPQRPPGASPGSGPMMTPRGLPPQTGSPGNSMAMTPQTMLGNNPSPGRSPQQIIPTRNLSELHAVAIKYPQYSMTKLAERKLRQLNIDPKPSDMFNGSQIVTGRDAQVLYFSLPFVSSPPKMQLLYSSRNYETNVHSIIQEVQHVQSQTVMVIRSGEFVFGGYITDPWRPNGQRFGNPKCFLFSITLDLKIPYHGRQKDAKSQAYGMGPVQHDCLAMSADFIQFGLSDLTVEGDFQLCTSELEFSYGIGLKPGSIDAKTLLAGSPTFKIDDIEVWALQ